MGNSRKKMVVKSRSRIHFEHTLLFNWISMRYFYPIFTTEVLSLSETYYIFYNIIANHFESLRIQSKMTSSQSMNYIFEAKPSILAYLLCFDYIRNSKWLFVFSRIHYDYIVFISIYRDSLCMFFSNSLIEMVKMYN